jgi:hypothetical protein
LEKSRTLHIEIMCKETNTYSKEVNQMENGKYEKELLAADLFSWADDGGSNLHQELTIPEVKKNNINIKMNNKRFNQSDKKRCGICFYRKILCHS